MTFPEVKLVDAPTATATVLFDFNDIAATPYRQVNADEFTIGVPALEGDVDAIDPLYGERVVSFTCNVRGTKAQVAALLSSMSRRLLAPGRGWLSVRLTATSDLLFFRTYRPQPGDLSFDLVLSASDTKRESWDVEVDIPCDPFAYGERITQLAKVVSQDPTSATGPTYFSLDPIIGDAPAPLRFQIGSSQAISGRTTMTLAHHASDSTALPVRVNIGGPADTTGSAVGSAGVTNKSASGYTGGTYAEIGFSVVNNPTLSLSFVNLRPARYRAFLRVVTSDSGTVVDVKAGQRVSAGDLAYSTTVRTSGGGSGTWLDLGTFQLPLRTPRSAADLPFGVNTSFELGFTRVAGNGALNVDHVVLVPVERFDTWGAASLSIEDVGLWADVNQRLVIDGDTEDAWSFSSTDGMLSGNTPEVRGVFPKAIPGVANVVEALFSTNPTNPAGSLTRNLTITASYCPRFLYIGDS